MVHSPTISSRARIHSTTAGCRPGASRNSSHVKTSSGGSKGNKGEEAAAALMDTLTSMDAIARAVAQVRPCEVERLETNLPQDKSENE